MEYFQPKKHLDVSKNRGVYPPKSSILMVFSIIFTIHFWGTSIFGILPQSLKVSPWKQVAKEDDPASYWVQK